MIRKSLLILSMFVLIIGCAATHKPNSSMALSPLTLSMIDVMGAPHIDNGSVRYYFTGWGPCCTLVKIHYDGDKILFAESEFIEDERVLGLYIPMLIESLRRGRPGDNGIRHRAHGTLLQAMYVMYPEGYYYYMGRGEKSPNPPSPSDFEAWEEWDANRHPRGAYADTPFESGVLTDTSYEEWKAWWETDGKRSLYGYPTGYQFVGERVEDRKNIVPYRHRTAPLPPGIPWRPQP